MSRRRASHYGVVNPAKRGAHRRPGRTGRRTRPVPGDYGRGAYEQSAAPDDYGYPGYGEQGSGYPDWHQESSGAMSSTRSGGTRRPPGGSGPATRAGGTRSGGARRRQPSGLASIAKGWWLILALAVSGFVLIQLAGFLAEIPLPEAAPGAQSSKLYDANGDVIYNFHGTENRTIVPLGSISQNLQQAVVASEDRSFYSHPGVSIRGIVRAAYSNLKEGEIGQGASTITQQYARTFAEVGRERTFARKQREATMAVKIERQYSKEKILEFYLNTVYFGRGAYGAEAAAQAYFNKPASELDLAEAAYLAGVIPSPSRYQVDENPELVPQIQSQVLDGMVEAGFITAEQAAPAKQANLAERFDEGVSRELDSPEAGYFIEYVRKLLLKEYGIEERDLLGGGLKIYTTLDMRMQRAAEEAVRSTLDRDDDPEVGLLAMDSQGQIKAMVGGRNVDDPKRARGFNFAANLPGDGGGRSPGSALKPVALAAFVDEGKSIRSSFRGPSNIKITSPLCLDEGKPWEVSNFDSAGYGILDITQATTRSVNTIYAQIMDKVVSPKEFISMAGRLGIEIPSVDEGCALALGTTAVTPLEMARAYMTFASHGQRPEPLIVLKVVSASGETVVENKPRSEQTIDSNVADTVSWILEKNVQSGTGTGARVEWPSMGKTGTGQEHQDASYAGATPELATAVWMGFPPDPETGRIPLMRNVRGRRVTGGSFPATIWRKFMAEALALYESHSGFPNPKITGEVLTPEPIECPTPQPPDDGGSPGPAPTPDDDGLISIVGPDGELIEDCVAPEPEPEEEEEPCGFPFDPCESPSPEPTKDPCFPFDCPSPKPPKPLPTKCILMICPDPPDPPPSPDPPPTPKPSTTPKPTPTVEPEPVVDI